MVNENAEGQILYGSYIHPDFNSINRVVVAAVEDKVLENLDSCAMGYPVLGLMAVKRIMSKITEKQGCIVENVGRDKMFDKVLEDIVSSTIQ